MSFSFDLGNSTPQFNTAPQFNVGSTPQFNTVAPQFNVGSTPQFNTSAPQFNTAAPQFNTSAPQFNVGDNNTTQQSSQSLQLGVNDYINNINQSDVIRDINGNIISYNVNSYKSYDSMRDHMYDNPNMYIGSTSHDLRKTALLDLTNTTELIFYNADCSIPHGVKQIFKEILSNASDNILKSFQHGYKMSKYPLRVTMDKQTVSIRNEGIPIPIIPAPSDPSIMKPEEIFGKFYQSQAYGKDIKSMAVAQNGIGAKTVSVFSKYFKVDIGSQNQGLRYEQVWRDNMKTKDNYLITQYSGESYVQITYLLDFQRFGYFEYPNDAFNLFAKEVVDAGFSGRYYSKFNDIPIHVKNIVNYAKLTYGPNLPNHIVHYEWPDGSELTTKKGKKVPVDPRIVPLVEMMYLDTPGNGERQPFVNGLLNPHGGIHVTSAYEVFSKEIIEKMADSKKKPRKGKEAKKVVGGRRVPKITVRDVMNHVSLIVSVRMYKPIFDAQTKTEFVGYEVNGKNYTRLKIVLDSNIKKTLGHWQTLFALQKELQFKKLNALKSTDGKRGRVPYIEKAQKANYAGNPSYINQTMLILVEGKSAKGWATMLISQKPNGRDFWGVYPLKGKMLNSINADFEQIMKNEEFKEIKLMLNLQEGLDYTIETNYRTLHYGKVAVATDADHDGKHIAGLFYLFIADRFPSLLKVPGFINYIRTPIVRVKGNKHEGKMSFYSIYDYEVWCNGPMDNPFPEKEVLRRRNMTPKYYKGLASAKEKDIKEDYEKMRLVQMYCDDKTFENLKLAFDNKMADDRKLWMEAYKIVIGIENWAHLGYSDFINAEFIQFALTNVGRSIPGIDGLKESHRKCLYSSFLKWGAKAGDRNAHQEKIAQLVGYIANKTGYHYGENSLVMAIYAMNRRWAGTNNMSLFWPKSMLGTRNGEGEDGGQPRYTFTKLSPWIREMFPKIDEDLYKIIVDEGKNCEPELLYPILPISMVNGVLGIGTGYSTFIPNFYPPLLCEWIRNRLLGLPLPELYPWYNNYRGIINIEYKKQLSKKKKLKVDGYDDIFGGDLNLDGIDSTNNVDFYYKPGKTSIINNVHEIISDVNSSSLNSFDIRFDIQNDNVPKFNISSDTPQFQVGGETAATSSTISSTATTTASSANTVPQFQINGSTPEAPKKTVDEMNKEFQVNNRKRSEEYTRPSMAVIGMFRYARNQSGRYDVEIIEIPITISFEKYESFLNKLVEEKKLGDFKNSSTSEFPHFLLYNLTFKPTVKSLKLRKNFGLTNMVLLSPTTGKPVKYRSSQDIIEHFFSWRYPIYVKRKEFLLKQKQDNINKLNNRKKFILAAINYDETKIQIDGVNVRIMNLPKDEVHRQMLALGLFDVEKLLKSVGSHKYLIESVKKLDIEIQKMLDDYDALYKTSIEQLWIADLEVFLNKYYQNFSRDDVAGRYNGNIDFVKAEEEEEKKLKDEAKLAKKKKEGATFDISSDSPSFSMDTSTTNAPSPFSINNNAPSFSVDTAPSFSF